MLKLPRLDRKLQVLVEWTMRLFFPRSINTLDIRTTTVVPHLHLEAGEVLFRQGEVSGAFYVIESGRLELTQTSSQGDVVLREELGPGEHFGEGSLLRRRVRTTTARALEPSTVLVLKSQLFDELAQRWELLRAALQNTSRRFALAADLLPAAMPKAVLELPCVRLMSPVAATLPHAATLEEAIRAFTRHGHSCLPLVDPDGCLVGLATRTDLYRELHTDLDLQAPIEHWATCDDLRTVRPEDPVREAATILRRRGVQHVPVVDAARRVVGIISFRDLMREILAQRVTSDSPTNPRDAAPDTASPADPMPKVTGDKS